MFQRPLIILTCLVLALVISIGSFSVFRSTEKLFWANGVGRLCSGVDDSNLKYGTVVSKSGFPFHMTQEVGVIYGGCAQEEKVIPVANSPYNWQLFANWLVWSGLLILSIIGVQKIAYTRH